MGIHDRTNPFSKVVQIADVQSSRTTIHESYTSDDASSVASEQPCARPCQQRTRVSRTQNISYQSLVNRLQKNSRRMAKRHSHLNFAKSLVGIEESDIEDDYLSTPDDYGRSAFSSLFSEAANMQAWNMFVELSEEEQQRALSSINEETGDANDGDYDADRCDEGFEIIDGDSSGDMRSVHPSFSSEVCFQQIDHHIKTLLRKRHFPMGLLESLEYDIRQYCQDCPYAMFEPHVTSSFGRLFVHAIAQYLSLEATSYNVGKYRRVSVINKKDLFCPPPLLLSEYLERLSVSNKS